ncbi:hypothetical protein ACROYT_G035759, partial [Oculina patagonica]
MYMYRSISNTPSYSQSGKSTESDFSASSPQNMAKKTGLQIDNTNLWAGIAILLFLGSPSSLEARTTRLTSLNSSLLNMKIPLSVMLALAFCHFSSKTAMISNNFYVFFSRKCNKNNQTESKE